MSHLFRTPKNYPSPPQHILYDRSLIVIAIVVTVIITSIIISVVLTQVFQQIWQIHSAQIRFDTILKTMTQMFLTFTVKLLRHIG